jgi:hypothetical protein
MREIEKIISGGQTGADRAAFDFALENGIEISGYVPKNRLAEDGKLPEKYTNLRETDSGDPAARTELNVKNSDATLILTNDALRGGSKLTAEFAEKYGKPFRRVDLSILPMSEAVEKTREWLGAIECKTLNVAGPRASEDGEIYAKTKEFLNGLFRDK